MEKSLSIVITVSLKTKFIAYQMDIPMQPEGIVWLSDSE